METAYYICGIIASSFWIIIALLVFLSEKIEFKWKKYENKRRGVIENDKRRM